MRIFPIIDCIIIKPNSIKITLTSSSFLSPSNMLSCVLLTTKNNKINRTVELVKYGKSGYLLHVMRIFPKMTASQPAVDSCGILSPSNTLSCVLLGMVVFCMSCEYFQRWTTFHNNHSRAVNFCGVLSPSNMLSWVLFTTKNNKINGIVELSSMADLQITIILILPTMSKIIERVMHSQLYAFLNENNLITEQQYGSVSNLAALGCVRFCIF